MEHTIDYIKSTCPDAVVILDSKRGDIGSTAEQYALEAFERYDADAVTVNPYLGRGSVEPFLKLADKGVDHSVSYVESGREGFSGSRCGRQEAVPARRRAGSEGMEPADNCMLVVGATYPEELADIRGASAICRCWCRVSARRAAMWRR